MQFVRESTKVLEARLLEELSFIKVGILPSKLSLADNAGAAALPNLPPTTLRALA
jgi:hypothetical protein